MTARPEAPTLDEQLTHTRSCVGLNPHEDCTCGLQWRIREQTALNIAAAWTKRATEAEERLRAIEQAARMPEPVAECPSNIDGTMYECEWSMGYVSTHDYDALRTNCLHLKDRLARMEALLREPEKSEDGELDEMAALVCQMHNAETNGKAFVLLANYRYALRKRWSAALLAKLEKE